MIQNALFNDEFLNDLFKQTNRDIYARITVLTQQENAIEYIEGKVQSGSINVDGKSAIRRSCSLTLVLKDISINDFYWSINSKFKLEVGISNETNNDYDSIIWFPQGIFVITNFDTNITTKNCQVSIKGKDKMCLLNGEFGGHLPHSTDFGKEEYHDLINDTVTYTDIPIKTIIYEIVRNFGGEPPQNIIVNDIEDAGLQLMEYRGKTPMFMFREELSEIFMNITFNNKQSCYYTNSAGMLQKITIDNDNIIYDNLVDIDNGKEPTKVILSLRQCENLNEQEFYRGLYYEEVQADSLYKVATTYRSNKKYYKSHGNYYIAKFEYGSTPGYKLTELTYAGDLISKAGDTVVTVLDKLKSMLGDFEYFYNVDGKFVFQKKKNYNVTNWHNSEEDEVIYGDSLLNMDKPIFSLMDSKLVTSFKNSPKIADIKNDYCVWGNRRTSSGIEVPIHARYAIDIKPTYYKSYDNIIYTTNANLLNEMAEKRKEELLNELLDELAKFKLSFDVPSELQLPKKLEDGSYTAGWWDIRDWYLYYQIIKKEIPNRTMKWYSKNDKDGCVPVNTIPGYETRSGDVWLIIKDPRNNTYNIQHGSGTFPGREDNELCYYSVLDPTAPKGYRTYPTNPPEYGKFWSPYNGCTETHTYLEFLKSDVEKKGNLVYFYNPNFPGVDSTQDAIADQVEKEIEEFKKSYTVKFVDWREIIYQMALDYRKHYHDDDFLYNIAQNNIEYYPTGITGYERYYVDLEGFWRTLYNPNPSPITEDITYEEAPECHANNTLYIKNSFRKLLEKEKDEYLIDLNNVYILNYLRDAQDENLSDTPDIVPFLGSEYCHLNFYYDIETDLYDYTKSDDVYFYIDSSGLMNEGDKNVETLNKQNLTDIYIKERGPFITLEGYEDDTDAEIRKYYYVKKYEEELDVDPTPPSPPNPDNPDPDNPDPDNPVDPDNPEETIPDNALFDANNSLFYTNDSKLFLIKKIENQMMKSVYGKTVSNKDNFILVGKIDENTFDSGMFYYYENNKYILAKSYNSNTIYYRYNGCQFWVFKYPFGTPLNQYPDDYTNYAAQAFQTYLNTHENAWDNLYIRVDTPIKFSELDPEIQRLYYKEIAQDDVPLGILTEYIQFLQYDNFNRFKTNSSELTVLINDIDPSSFYDSNDFIEEIENLSKIYAGELTEDAATIIQQIADAKKESYSTPEAYLADVKDGYNRFLNVLQNQYSEKINSFNFKTEIVAYHKVFFDFYTDEILGNYWSKMIDEQPELLDFWFDFINGETSHLSKYSIQAVGPRTKVVNDKDVKAIYYKEVPNTIFISSRKEYESYSHQSGYNYIQLPAQMNSVFTISSRGKSAKSAVEDLLYQHCYATETATIGTVPIYHLQPNTCIYVRDDNSGIEGDYLISKITVPLDTKKTMSITATKVMPNII